MPNDPVVQTQPASPLGNPTPTPTAEPTSSTTPTPEPQPTTTPTPTQEPPAFDVADVTIDSLKALLPKDAALNEPLANEFLSVLNGAKSRGDLAKGMVDLQTKIETGAVEAMTNAWNDTLKSWKDAAAADKEIGGANLEANLAKSRTVLETYSKNSTELKELFALTGVGNHPAMVKFLLAVQAAIPTESTPVQGSPVSVESTRAKRLFGGSSTS